MVERLFAYGTLREAAIQLRVFGRAVAGEPDVLEGFEKTSLTMSDGTFPIIFPNPTARVEGLLLELTPEELRRCDLYETSAYRRIRVILQSGRESWVYCAP